jgi:GPI mannosyltransferase 4
MILAGSATLFLALSVDTAFYNPSEPFTFRRTLLDPVITPLNNLRYNSSHLNLAEHGIHPYYQHLVANLPQLLGPAFPLIFISPRRSRRLYSAVCGIFVLSCFPHQEARFLMPAVPLLLSSIRLPRRFLRAWIGVWLIFNVIFGVLMGGYHQGGVVPAQSFLSKQENIRKAYYWKTYSPPIWLINGNATGTEVVTLMGAPGKEVIHQLSAEAPCSGKVGSWLSSRKPGSIVLAAPYSATFLDPYTGTDSISNLNFTEIWRYRRHINFDDLDIGEEGLGGTITRVIGRRGLRLWKVEKKCS